MKRFVDCRPFSENVHTESSVFSWACRVSPRSSVAIRVFVSAKVRLSNEAWAGSPSTKMEIRPLLRFSRRSTRKIDPHDPRAARSGALPEVASVSPVGQKKKVRKPDPGRKAAFSGRLKGVATAVFAAAFASNEAVP